MRENFARKIAKPQLNPVLILKLGMIKILTPDSKLQTKKKPLNTIERLP